MQTMKTPKTWIAGCLLLLAAAACKRGATAPLTGKAGKTLSTLSVTNYYVNGATGNDANAGTSPAAALKTIQAALNKTTDGMGATIYVAGGTYKERLWWPNSGASAAEPITLTNYDGGVVTLDGVDAANDGQAAMIAISSKSHIRIHQDRIANNIRDFAAGIYVAGSGTDIHVTNCKIYNIGWTTDSTAVPTSSDNANPLVVVGSAASSYNEIYIGGNEIYSCNTGYSEGLTMAGNV